MKNFKFIIYILFLLLFVNIFGAIAQEKPLEIQFKNPTSEDASPWTIWYWMYGAVSKEGITADLEAMKEVGLGGTYLMPIRSPDYSGAPEFSPSYYQLTPEWWELIRFSMEEADRLNLKLGMHICDGFALAGGPWITPEKSMQKIVWTDTIISGGDIKRLQLPQPETVAGYYKDVALYAVPVQNPSFLDTQVPVVTSSIEDENPSYLADDYSSETFRSSDSCWIQYYFEKPFLCKSIKITPGGNNFQAQRLTVFSSDNGISFRKVKQLKPPRQGWQNTDDSFTYSLPATKSRYFRFYWSPIGTEPGAEDLDAAKWTPNLKVDKIILSSEPLIDQFEGKNGSVWRLANRTQADVLADEDCLQIKDIITIDPSSLSGSLLSTHLPNGMWRIIRMGNTSTGHTNATGGAAKGLECDKFSEDAVKVQLKNWFGAAFEKTDPVLAKRVLKYMHVESWECGSQNWSDSFQHEFKMRRGYDLSPYLLVYAGIPIGSAEKTEGILHDIRQTIAELVVDIFYKTLNTFAKEYDCKISAECVAPTMMSDGMLHYQMVDRPMGEFWLQSPTHDKFNDILDAVSGAHIYGKKLIQAEGFTQLRTMWNEDPRMIKPLLDRNFALGINKLFHHVYVHNPQIDKAPGMTLEGIGLYFQRDQTWWKQSNVWIEYIKRCQTLLQFGQPVVDIAVFTGEETPRRSLLPERLVGSLPGIFGAKKVITEEERLANSGQPMKVMPVGVKHSANITDAGDWIDPLNGYAYDSFNKDALLRLSEVKDGRLSLANGMSYKILVLPKPHSLSPDSIYMSIEVAEKIREIQREGVIVLLGNKPMRIPGFSDNPELNNELIGITEEIWNVSQNQILPYKNQDFNEFNLERDIDFHGAEDIAWTHRSENNIDIYFISNQINENRDLSISFRSAGRQPELWNPENGEITDIPKWKVDNNRTHINLNLHPNQSVFIVFKKSVLQNESNKHVSSEITPLKIDSWKISFVNNPSENLIRSELFDWSKEENKELKYYSGMAVYESDLYWDGNSTNKNVYLDLGEVNNIAEVYVNDSYCGTAWTYPNRVQISNAIKKGNNKLRINVVNTWANKIKGVYEGHVNDNKIWTNAPYRLENQPLQPSGLLGPLSVFVTDIK